MKVELLAPAGDWGMLRSAIASGADSVYFGVKTLNMRAMAKNFEITELKKVVDFCHKNKVKAYLTVNTIVFENELEDVKRVLNEAKKAKVDAIICWDLSVIKLAKKLNLDIHISTQASVANTSAVLEYVKLGAKRIVLARECNLEQIKEIALKVEVEVFCHGAMCVSESGRCFMSQFLWNKSANRGECLHPCRRSYTITDEEGRELKLENDRVMSAKDLCTISFVDKLINSGVKCLKIEGRGKTADYVAKVVSVYREAIDTKNTKAKIAKWEKELKSVFNRGFSTGFFLGKPINEWSKGLETSVKREFLGEISKYYPKLSVAEVKLVDSLKVGDIVSIHSERTPYFEQKIESIHADLNEKTLTVKSAGKGTLVAFRVKNKVREGDKVFKLIKKI